MEVERRPVGWKRNPTFSTRREENKRGLSAYNPIVRVTRRLETLNWIRLFLPTRYQATPSSLVDHHHRSFSTIITILTILTKTEKKILINSP
jgi:hypothetical protein